MKIKLILCFSFCFGLFSIPAQAQKKAIVIFEFTLEKPVR